MRARVSPIAEPAVAGRRGSPAAALLTAGLLALPTPARAEPEVRLYDGALVLRPYVLLQLDAGTTFGHDRDGGPGAGFNPRRLRLGVEAEVLRDVEAVLIWNFGGVPGSRSRLYQASLSFHGLDPFVVTAGVFKSHFSLEEMQSSGDTLFLERAAVVSAAAGIAAGSRRTGVQLRAGRDRWLVSAALTGGETGPGSDSGQRGAAARVAGLPVQGQGFAVHLGLSGAVSWRPPSEEGMATVGLSARPELAVDRWSSPLDAGSIAARQARTGGVEAGLGWRRLWAQSEAYRIEVDRAGTSGGTLGFSGWYASAAYTVLGTPRAWKPASAAWGAPTPPPDGFNPARGQWGAVEIGARISELHLSDAEIRGGRQRVWTAGVNLWPVETVRVTLQYQHVAIRGTAEDRTFQAIAIRGQLKF